MSTDPNKINDQDEAETNDEAGQPGSDVPLFLKDKSETGRGNDQDEKDGSEE